MSDKKKKRRVINTGRKFTKDLRIIIENSEYVTEVSPAIGTWCIMVGNIKITNPRIGKPGVVHITTGRADSLEGGDFMVSELEEAIQDFFDKNF